MTNVLVLGAGGQIARWVIEMLADSKDVEMTLYLRHARKLHGKPPKNAKVIEGDVLDRKVLDAAIKGQNVVYANLTGDDIDKQAKSILASMKSEGVDPAKSISASNMHPVDSLYTISPHAKTPRKTRSDHGRD